jgi:hypothetical protein
MKPVRKPNVLVAAGDVATMEAAAAVGIAGAAVAVDVEVIAEIAGIAATAGNWLLLLSFPFRASGHSPMRPKHNFQPGESF